MITRTSRSTFALSTLVAACVASVLHAVPVRAESQTMEAREVQFSVPRQSAASGILEFARQADIQILVSERILEDKQTAEVQGSYSVSGGLEALLSGTGLIVQSTDGKTVTLQLARLRTAMLDVGPGQSATETAEDTGELATVNVFGTLKDEVSAGSKNGLTLREVPKSVTVVTRERIEAQNLSSLVDVLGQTTGVTLASYTSVDTFFFSRGFRVQTMQIDAGAPAFTGDFGSYLPVDMAVYDHVEMLRGVDGMYSGAGEPGGVVNLVRKRAKATPAIELNLSGGSWNSFRGELDATGALTDDGRLRGRFVAARGENDYFYDRASSEKTILFGTGEYDLTPTTLLIAGASYERRKEDGYFTWGFPRYSDGRSLDLPTSAAFNPKWAHWYFTNKEAFAKIEQQYGDHGIVRLNVTHTEQTSENRQFVNYGAIDPVTLTGNIGYGWGNDFDSTQDLVDLSTSGRFPLFGLEHRYTVGADYARIDAGDTKSYRLPGYDYPGPAIDVFNFDPSLYPEPVAEQNGYYPDNGQTQRGVYATLGIQLAKPLRLTLGGRYGKYKYLTVFQGSGPDGSPIGAPSVTRYDDSKFIPSAALSYDFSEDWSAYASYAETFKVQASSLAGPLPGSPLPPVTGEGVELGVKGEIGGLLNASAALYRVSRNGQAVNDPAYPPLPGGNGSSCCYLSRGDVISKGLDTEISGTVLPGWQMFAGYTFNESEYKGPEDGFWGAGGYFLDMTPKHMLKLWTTWQLPGEYSRWTFNAGVVAQTESYVSGSALAEIGGTDYVAYKFAQSGYSIWNAAVQYRLGEAWTIGVYGDNLFNKKYYQVLGDTGRENVYGTPRNVTLNIRARW